MARKVRGVLLKGERMLNLRGEMPFVAQRSPQMDTASSSLCFFNGIFKFPLNKALNFRLALKKLTGFSSKQVEAIK